jgi:hypothetical protein
MDKEQNKNGKDIKRLAEILRLITDNFRIFVSEIIGLDNAPFQNELDDSLSCELNKKLCIALPRGHGKSTHLSIAYPLWEIGRNHNVRILLVSNTAETARHYMTEIISHIERNKKYQLWAKAIDPKGKGIVPKMRWYHKREENWAGDSIIIDREDIRVKDPTINAVGLFGSILSSRADILIVDDLVNQENSTNEEQRQKIKDWVYTTLMPVLVPGGRFINLGSTWHMDDLISNLLKDPQFDVRKRLPAIIHEANRQDLWQEWANFYLDDSLSPEEKKTKATEFYAEHKKEMDEGIEVLWPERFPYPDLYLLRIANPYSFARMYQCDPSIRPNQKFLENDIEKALYKGRDLVLQDELPKEYQADYTTSGLDLAISQQAWGHDTVLLTLDRVKIGNGEIKTGDYVIRNIERGKFSPNEVRELVLRHYHKVKPLGIRVESVAFQESMSLDLGERGIPVRSYHTGGEKNDPDIGVNSLAILLSQGKLILPYSNKDARTRQLVTQLINEMRSYPEGHTGDSLMALWFAFSEIRDCTANRPCFAPLNGPSWPNYETPKENPQKDEELKPGIGLMPTPEQTKSPSKEQIKQGERQADLEIMKRQSEEAKWWL